MTVQKEVISVGIHGEEVARLTANISGVLDMHYENSNMKELHSNFELLRSKYDTVDP